MKHLSRFRLLSLAAMAFMMFTFSGNLSAATWYIDALSGDDSYDGTTPVFVSGNTGPFKSIMFGVSQANPGDTLRVAAGSYFEQLLIDRAIVILGNNEGIWGTGTRATESVIFSPSIGLSPTPAAPNSIVTIQASDVVIRGFELNGDNTSLISGSIVNGADVDMATGFFVDGSRDRVEIANNRIINCMFFGIVGQADGLSPASGSIFSGNYLGNYGADSYAIACLNNFYATIQYNTTRVVPYAMLLDVFSQSLGDPWMVDDNDFECYGSGVLLTNFNGNPDKLEMVRNRISVASGQANEGIVATAWSGASKLYLEDNLIKNFQKGVALDASAPDYVMMKGDTIRDCEFGIWWANSLSTSTLDTLELMDVHLIRNIQGGINAQSVQNPLTIVCSDVVIEDSDLGIGMEGDVRLVPGNLAFSNISFNYFVFNQSGMGTVGTQDVDARNVTFQGVRGAVMTEAQCFDTEDKMIHYPDDQIYPHIEFKQNFIYVTGANGNDSIQPALDKIQANGQVVVKGLNTGEELLVNKSCTITSSGIVTVNSLTMDGGFGQLNLINEMQVRDSLNLRSGLINTQSGLLTMGLLNIQDPKFVAQGSPASYVTGAMRVVNMSSASDTVYFPIGKSGDFRPMRMVITHSNNGEPSAYRAEVINSPVAGNTIASTLSHISAKRYWLVLQNGNPSVTNVSYTLTYGTIAMDDEVGDPANLRVSLLENTTWLDLGGLGSAAGTGLIQSSLPYSKFGPVTLANAKGGANALGRRGPSAEFTFSGSCAVDSFSFTDASNSSGDPIATRHWDFGETGRTDDTSNALNPKWLYNNPGTYSVKLVVTTTTGEKDSVEYNVTSYASPNAGFTTDVPCAPENIEFRDTSGLSGVAIATRRWILNDTLIFGSAATQFYAPSTGSHNIKLWLENTAGCRDSVQQSIYYGDSIKLTLSPGRNIIKCTGESVTLTVSGIAQKFLWNTGDTTLSITVQNPGKYIIQATNSNSCEASDSATVLDTPSPVADAGPDLEITLGESTPIGGISTSGMNYRWTPAEGLNDARVSNPVAGPSETTTYVLRVFNAVGCDSYDSMTLTVNKPTVMIIPNLISPNGDGANDTWNLISVPGIANSKVTIFNRWGREVYSSDNYNHDWDGSFEGEPLPEGTYVYIIEFGTPGLGTAKGNLQIIR